MDQPAQNASTTTTLRTMVFATPPVLWDTLAIPLITPAVLVPRTVSLVLTLLNALFAKAIPILLQPAVSAVIAAHLDSSLTQLLVTVKPALSNVLHAKLQTNASNAKAALI